MLQYRYGSNRALGSSKMPSHKTTIPPVVLYGSENWFYAIGE